LFEHGLGRFIVIPEIRFGGLLFERLRRFFFVRDVKDASEDPGF
jgi:hypothetical protein